MKWLDIKKLSLRVVLATVLCAGALPLQAQTLAPTDTVSADSTDSVQSPTRYERRIDRYVLRWSKLIPSHSTLQYAGSIGLISAGIGWHYGKNAHWETDLLVGFLPKYHSRSAHATFTVKERYIPWRCHVHPQWTIEPLTAGAFFNTISGEDFWRHQPSRYPKKYYGMPDRKSVV